MKTIFDPVDRWIVGGPLMLAPGNKPPVAIDDALVVLVGSGPVSVDVLANDFDPEGRPLTLVSASAALGTAAVAPDDTVTYTPPPFAGFDTVVYTIADDLGQTRQGQIDVAISEPQLSIVETPGNTLEVNAEPGTLDITITAPAEFADTYQIDTADLLGGPVNLVAPSLAGTVAPGEVLTATGGLWVYDPGAGQPVRSWQWRRGGVDIPGETTSAYTLLAGDIGPGISARETQTDGHGQRTADTPTVGAAFTPAADAALIGWWDASDAATITASSGAVSAWADKAGGAALIQSAPSLRPTTGLRSLNGRNVLDFPSRALYGSRAFPATGNVAFHAAFVIDSVNNAFAAILAVEATNDFQIDANAASAFNGRLNPTGIGNPVNLTGGPFSGAFILSAVFDRTGSATAEIFVSNVSRGSTAYTAPIETAAALHLMTNRSMNAWIDGAVAELIVTGDVTNRDDHHAYLANKWGLI